MVVAEATGQGATCAAAPAAGAGASPKDDARQALQCLHIAASMDSARGESPAAQEGRQQGSPLETSRCAAPGLSSGCVRHCEVKGSCYREVSGAACDMRGLAAARHQSLFSAAKRPHFAQNSFRRSQNSHRIFWARRKALAARWGSTSFTDQS